MFTIFCTDSHKSWKATEWYVVPLTAYSSLSSQLDVRQSYKQDYDKQFGALSTLTPTGTARELASEVLGIDLSPESKDKGVY